MTYSTQLTANGHFDGYAIGLQGGISNTVFFPLTDGKAVQRSEASLRKEI